MKYRYCILLTGIILFLCVSHSSQAACQGGLKADSASGQPACQGRDGLNQEESDDFEKESPPEVYDPLAPYNRFMTQVNDKLYFWMLKPAAQGYSKVVPEPVRLAVNRFFKNLYFPVRGVNNLLQLKYQRAGIETARFGINTTVGILGFFDPAEICWNMDAYPEDFGQTLGYYRFGPGFHIVVPFLGPSNLRDAFGTIPDLYLNPLDYVHANEAVWALYAEDKINAVSLHIGDYEAIRNASLDLYISLRNAYETNREKQIEK